MANHVMFGRRAILNRKIQKERIFATSMARSVREGIPMLVSI